MTTVIPLWTGNSLVWTTTEEPTLEELPLRGESLHAVRRQAKALGDYLRLLLEAADTAQLARLGYGYDGRPLRGRR